jgi:hypothetical protein
VGKVSIIISPANDEGVEHCDHSIDDLVSEFVWIRPPGSKKRFYVRDQVRDSSHSLAPRSASTRATR